MINDKDAVDIAEYLGVVSITINVNFLIYPHSRVV